MVGILAIEEYEDAYVVLGVSKNASSEDINNAYKMKSERLDKAISQTSDEKRRVKDVYKRKRKLLDKAISQIGDERRVKYDFMLAGRLPLDQQAIALIDISGISTVARLEEDYDNLLKLKRYKAMQKEKKQVLKSMMEYIKRYKKWSEFKRHLEDLVLQYDTILQPHQEVSVPPITRHHYIFIVDNPNKDPVDMAIILSKVGVVNSTKCQIFYIHNSKDKNKISTVVKKAAGTVLNVKCSHGWNSRSGVGGLQTLMKLMDGSETCVLQLTVSKKEHKRMEEEGSLSEAFLKVARTFYWDKTGSVSA